MRHPMILVSVLAAILVAPAATLTQTAAPFTIIVTSLDSNNQIVFDYRLLPDAGAWYLPTAEDMENPATAHGEGLTTPDTIEVWVTNFSAAFYDVNKTGSLHVRVWQNNSAAGAGGKDIMNVWGRPGGLGATELDTSPESVEDPIDRGPVKRLLNRLFPAR